MYAEDYATKVLSRFWTKVEIPGDLSACWEWQASRRNGYGQFGVRAGDVRGAHRYAYEHFHGYVTGGLHLDHLCRNRGCCNPAHLEPVTCAENVLRGVSAGAINARKTHCLNGHEFDEANTYVDKRGRRQCRACRAKRSREFNARNPEYMREWCRRYRERLRAVREDNA